MWTQTESDVKIFNPEQLQSFMDTSNESYEKLLNEKKEEIKLMRKVFDNRNKGSAAQKPFVFMTPNE